ncbi:MAG TPA: phosphohydrolase [Muricauda sp.]|uniref:HD domain-containing protein n=1 Tax=Flagellimonas aurea TaxID=2915619 RepID=UPI000E7E4719|nr:HD domain-containing protein [uncultured Allomuricauda sp.]UBZ15978.1 HD domain-containing protein [Allomuricauda aquimarina]HBU77537.1 phosphohydrolase [Allomuricauda sp.]|tara:strand:- start:1213 stop:1869 length:657 start_codon:yes stop_codon:yes gene_type:complete
MKEDQLIQNTIDFVKKELQNAEGGHDWFHIERVFNTSKLILKHEEGNTPVVKLAVLLHDIADPKFHGGDESIGPQTAKNFLESQSVDEQTIEHVVKIIVQMSFKNSLEKGTKFTSNELQIVQDADRLDAIGAIGIARAFNYGGFKNRELHNPDVPPNLNMSKEEYKKSTAPTINHFYEKLLLLKDKMNTETGKKLAEERHKFMLDYLDQFYKEWNGTK